MIIIIVIMIIMMIPILPSKCERAHLENGTGVKISRRLARHTGILFNCQPAGNLKKIKEIKKKLQKLKFNRQPAAGNVTVEFAVEWWIFTLEAQLVWKVWRDGLVQKATETEVPEKHLASLRFLSCILKRGLFRQSSPMRKPSSSFPLFFEVGSVVEVRLYQEKVDESWTKLSHYPPPSPPNHHHHHHNPDHHRNYHHH